MAPALPATGRTTVQKRVRELGDDDDDDDDNDRGAAGKASGGQRRQKALPPRARTWSTASVRAGRSLFNCAIYAGC